MGTIYIIFKVLMVLVGINFLLLIFSNEGDKGRGKAHYEKPKK